jgi:hypothetical protein
MHASVLSISLGSIGHDGSEKGGLTFNKWDWTIIYTRVIGDKAKAFGTKTLKREADIANQANIPSLLKQVLAGHHCTRSWSVFA